MKPNTEVTVALVQQAAGPDRGANRAQGLRALEEAARQGADVVAFAELAFDRFHPAEPAGPDRESFAETIPGPTTEMFCEAAAQHGLVVVLNLLEVAQAKTYDSSPVIDADGSLLGVTRMVHIPDYACFHEKSWYTPGDRGAGVYDTAAGKIGIAICYDRHYPEYMRALALAGADLVIVPQAGCVGEWPEGLFEAEMRTAAFQNGYFVALVNRVGEEPRLTFAGESFITNPEGRVITRAQTGTETVLLASCEMSQVEHSTARRLFVQDRRPELYADWLCAPTSAQEKTSE